MRNNSNGNHVLNKVLEKVAEELEMLDEVEQINAYHDTKRRLSFDKLDNLLNACNKGICPKLNPEDHMYLIDISAACYIHERAYYYSLDKIGIDDTDRYHLAEKRLKKVFDCPVINPELDSSLFETDCASLAKIYRCDVSAKKRKAYWRFLARQATGEKVGNAESDYCGACNILDSACDSGKKATILKNKDFWLKNLDIINGIDLFRYCLFRSNHQ